MAVNSVVNKLIKFYIIQAEPSLYFNMSNSNLDNNLYALFKLGFKDEVNYYSFEFNEKQLFFDIKDFNKDFNKDFIFGTCSIEENIKPTAMIQSRDTKTNQTSPFTTLDNNNQLEAYTFFYIDFINCRMAAISNKKIAKIHEAITSFVWKNSKDNQVPRISIYPEKVNNMKKALQSFKRFKKLNVEFAKLQNLDDIKSLPESLKKDFTVEKYKLELKIKSTTSTFIENLLSTLLKNNSNLSNLSLIGNNELGVEETINLIEAVYTKTVQFELTDDTVTNLNYIKSQLQNHLQLHLTQY